MKKLLPLISWLGLALVIVPPMLYLVGSTDKHTMQWVMLAGTILWFGTVPFWMGRSSG